MVFFPDAYGIYRINPVSGKGFPSEGPGRSMHTPCAVPGNAAGRFQPRGDSEMGFNATVLEVILIAIVGGTIGFVMGLRLGAYLADASPAH